MKKILLCAAIVCAMFASCTPESYFDVENAQVESFDANRSTFDEEAEIFLICCDLIKHHKECDWMWELLPERLSGKVWMTWSLDEMVEIVYIWWQDYRSGDVLVEDCTWDDFLPNLPERYFDMYHWEY